MCIEKSNSIIYIEKAFFFVCLQLRIFLRSITLRVINQMNHAVSVWRDPSERSKLREAETKGLGWDLTAQVGWSQPGPAMGKGAHWVWPDSSGPGAYLWLLSWGPGGSWSCQRLSSSLRVSLCPMDADPHSSGGGVLVRFGHPTPCLSGHQHLRK